MERNVDAVPPGHRPAVLEEERGLDRRVAVEPLGERPGVGAVDHPGAIRRRHERVGPREGLRQGPDVLDGRLAVVRAEDDVVAFEELVRPAGCLE